MSRVLRKIAQAGILIAILGAVPLTFAESISRVDFIGNQRIEKDALIEKMSLKVGVEITPALVKADILSIFNMGFFEDIRFDLDGTVLLVTLKERPVITKITYEGNDELENKELEEATGLKAFNVLNPLKIKQAQTAIAKKYEEKGYYLARAEYELKAIPKRSTEIEVIFHISENERVRVRKVFFLGNKHFTTGELKQVMGTSEGHAFSWMTGGGTYREGAFERDLALLAYFYANDGYIEAKFSKPRVTLSQDRRYIDILIDVNEGIQFYLGNVSFRGDDLFTPDELRRSFDMKEKDIFSAGKLQEEVLKLTDKYGDLGYAFANIIPRSQTREGTNIVDLSFDVERGEKVYWGKITVTGNSKTHDKVVRRELTFNEGELYNATKRKKALEHVKRLGFFGSDVNFLTSTPKGSTNILDLEVHVTEKATGSLNISAGYGSGSGFQFGGQISQQNLFGLGRQLSFNVSLNAISKTFNFEYVDPKIFDSEWLFGFNLYIQEAQVGGIPRTYDQRLSGGSFRLGREVADNFNLYGVYKLEHAYLTNPVNPILFHGSQTNEYIVSSVTTTLAYDSRNNRLDPSGGEYFSASSEFAGLGGSVFQKYLLAVRFYRKLFWRFVYRSNFEYGFLTNQFSGADVPDSERFILGGIFSLRGYAQSTVGPTITLKDSRDLDPTTHNPIYPNPYPYVVGGTQKMVIQQEVEFPLIPEADIRLALFFDTGNSWNDLRDRNPTFLADYGWGIRWYSPLGPLRFEWGYPLATTPSKTDLGSEFHFIIAPTF